MSETKKEIHYCSSTDEDLSKIIKKRQLGQIWFLVVMTEEDLYFLWEKNTLTEKHSHLKILDAFAKQYLLKNIKVWGGGVLSIRSDTVTFPKGFTSIFGFPPKTVLDQCLLPFKEEVGIGKVTEKVRQEPYLISFERVKEMIKGLAPKSQRVRS